MSCMSAATAWRARYRNQPALTAKKFIPHPFDRTPGARLYATGDRARFLPDGRVEYLVPLRLSGEDSRISRRARGHRGDAGPASSRASGRRHSGERRRRHAAAGVCGPGSGRDLPGVLQLRAFLEAKLPDYMVPSQFTMMSSLPLTASGKVNRRALPKCDRPAAAAHRRDERPGTPTEANLAAIWAELFHVTTIGIDDNFFDLGGHSLLAARACSPGSSTASARNCR